MNGAWCEWAASQAAAWLVVVGLTIAPASPELTGSSSFAELDRRECVMVQGLDGSAPFVSDAVECAVKSAPASTFKIPHALIALETGVIADALDLVKWGGSKQPFAAWERDHSLDSAMKASVVWFFQRTAALIGRDRMRDHLKRLAYADDTFEGDLTTFWLNGDLVVSPEEQFRFMRRLVQYALPVDRHRVDAVKAAFLMPSGTITNASGVHDFRLDWPEPVVVRAKTGNTTVGEERVSWLVGHLEVQNRQYVFVSRVRATETLSGTAGADLAVQALNAHRPTRR
jgi:beta-lactamase class D